MRIFYTHILPEPLVRTYGLSFAACNFSRNLISGGGFDKVYSTMPTFVSGDLCVDDPDCEIIYSGLRRRGRLLSKVAVFFEQYSLFKKIPKGTNLWLYNIGYLNVFLYILLRLFKRSVKIFVIELDFTPPTNKWCSMAWFLKLLNLSDGVIKLSDSELFTNKNSVCLPGVTPLTSQTYPTIIKPELEFLLSGVLHPDISSIPIILDAFAQFPNCRLHITGEWNDMDIMNEYTLKYPNIIYHGVVSYNDYFDLLHNVTFQLSLRNPDWADNMCNFPSKIIEALLHNRAVISTIHYHQLDGIRFFVTDRSLSGFVNVLNKISSLPSDKLLGYANQGQIVSERYSVKVWDQCMAKLENNS